MTEEVSVRVVTVICLSVVLLASVIGMTVTAVLTDRDMFRAEVLTFAGVALLAAFGGVSWFSLTRHKWRLNVERDIPNGTRRRPDGTPSMPVEEAPYKPPPYGD